MKRTEILEIINTEQNIHPVLSQINNPHSVGVMQYLSQMFAAVCELIFNRMDLHQREIENLVLTERWATPAWYVNKAKEFQYGFELIADEYTRYNYDNTEYLKNGGSQASIDESKVIKQAAVSFTGKRMVMKIAGELNGELTKLSDTVANAFRSYIEKIKRPGTPISIYNFDADLISIEYDIYFNGQLKETDVRQAAESTMRKYLANILFNGVFNTAELTDELQKTKGIIDPFLISATAKRAFDSPADAVEVKQYYSSYSGYMKYQNITLNLKRK